MNQVLEKSRDLSPKHKAIISLVELSRGDILIPDHEVVRLFEVAGADAINNKFISKEVKEIYLKTIPELCSADLQEVPETLLSKVTTGIQTQVIDKISRVFKDLVG